MQGYFSALKQIKGENILFLLSLTFPSEWVSEWVSWPLWVVLILWKRSWVNGVILVFCGVNTWKSELHDLISNQVMIEEKPNKSEKMQCDWAHWSVLVRLQDQSGPIHRSLTHSSALGQLSPWHYYTNDEETIVEIMILYNKHFSRIYTGRRYV